MVGSPVVANFREGYSHSRATEFERWDEERLGSSSPEPCDVPAMRSIVNEGVKSTGLRRPSAQDFEYSGDDLAPSSDFSDTALPQRLNKPVSESVTHSMLPGSSASKPAPTRYSNELIVPGTARNGSVAQMDQDEERVIWHGYLLCLKSKGGVRQWKRHWAVLRPKNLAFYKSEEVSFRQI